MDANKYLNLYGWEKGKALNKGGILKPIIFKQKKDQKGIGSREKVGNYIENVYDNQLKSLKIQIKDVQNKKIPSRIPSKSLKIPSRSLKKKEGKRRSIYHKSQFVKFVRSGVLEGSIGNGIEGVAKESNFDSKVFDNN